jgi:DNA-directed RNA polymerase I, II, and III subunit RPABC5
MIIPIRCVTCNNVLAGKYEAYLDMVKENRRAVGQKDSEMQYLTATTVKAPEGKALDDLGIKKMCCRRHMLSHVDML